MNNRVKLYNACCKRVMARMPDASVDLIVTDPPYKNIGGGSRDLLGGILKENDADLFKDMLEPAEFMGELFRVLKSGRSAYIFTNVLNMVSYITHAQRFGFKLSNILVWVKNTKTPNRWGMKDCEYILLFHKSPARVFNDCLLYTSPSPRD